MGAATVSLVVATTGAVPRMGGSSYQARPLAVSSHTSDRTSGCSLFLQGNTKKPRRCTQRTNLLHGFLGFQGSVLARDLFFPLDQLRRDIAHVLGVAPDIHLRFHQIHGRRCSEGWQRLATREYRAVRRTTPSSIFRWRATNLLARSFSCPFREVGRLPAFAERWWMRGVCVPQRLDAMVMTADTGEASRRPHSAPRA